MDADEDKHIATDTAAVWVQREPPNGLRISRRRRRAAQGGIKKAPISRAEGGLLHARVGPLTNSMDARVLLRDPTIHSLRL